MRRKVSRFAAALAVVTLLPCTASAGQDDEAARVLNAVRESLGGAKLDTLKSLSVEGRSRRTTPAGTTMESEFEMALELPDKFMRREVLSAMGNMSIYRTSGFNADGVINEIDTPPQLSGGMMHIRMKVADGPGDGSPPTEEQKERARKAMLLNSKQDFARLVLGVLARSTPAYPLSFSYAGTAESPDGKADVLDVKGEGGFVARLFIDAESHLPLMLTWMDKEPIVVTRTAGGAGSASFVSVGAGGGHPPAPPQGAKPGEPRREQTPEERDRMEKDLQAQIKEAESKRREVEFRLFYSDYQSVDGVLLPHRFARSVDGKPTEEVVFEKVKVNSKIDQKKFKVTQ